MTPSIRTYLLINLLLSVALITFITVTGNLIFSHTDIQKQLDAQLINTGNNLSILFSSKLTQEMDPNELAAIQAKINETKKFNQNLRTIEFQIWNNQGKLIIASANAPKVPLTNGKPGLSTSFSEHTMWRVNTLQNDDITIMVAERALHRQDLENRLTRDFILVMLITYPFLGLLIWLIVGKALRPLKKITTEVAHRAPTYLNPVDISEVPLEIVPLINELNNLFARLHEGFEREKRFTADAAHELKTPLAAISAQTQVALRADSDLNRREALEKILAGVYRSTHVIQQLLTLSRMVPQATLKDISAVNLAYEAADVAALLAPEALKKNIDLELLHPDNKATIMGNPTAINILIRNLIDNAIRYTQEDGWVKIDIIETEESVKLIVADNGPGIPEELHERVFERFFRMMGTNSTGSGLGLGIVQQIAQLHNAIVSLHTPKSGEGLEICVTFPKKS